MVSSNENQGENHVRWKYQITTTKKYSTRNCKGRFRLLVCQREFDTESADQQNRLTVNQEHFKYTIGWWKSCQFWALQR